VKTFHHARHRRARHARSRWPTPSNTPWTITAGGLRQLWTWTSSIPAMRLAWARPSAGVSLPRSAPRHGNDRGQRSMVAMEIVEIKPHHRRAQPHRAPRRRTRPIRPRKKICSLCESPQSGNANLPIGVQQKRHSGEWRPQRKTINEAPARAKHIDAARRCRLRRSRNQPHLTQSIRSRCGVGEEQACPQCPHNHSICLRAPVSHPMIHLGAVGGCQHRSSRQWRVG